MKEMDFEGMASKLANIPDSSVVKKIETTARIFGIEHKENYISNWLAFLIDPARFGSADPLNALLNLYFSKLELEEGGKGDNSVSEDEQVEVSREETLGLGERIDFLITTDKLMIGIESKIYAGLHTNQLKKYRESIRAMAQKDEEVKIPVLLLLTPGRSREVPSDDFIHVTFEELASAFRELHFDYLNNLRSAFLLEDFVNYVDEYFKGGESSMNEEWAKFIGTNAQELQMIYREGQKNLEKFKDDLVASLENAFPEEEWESNAGKNTPNQFYWQLNNDEWDRFNIHYEVGRMHDESTYGFILPEKLRLTLDIEDRQAQKHFTETKVLPFSSISRQNKIADIEMDYTNEKSLRGSLDSLVEELRKWDEQYRGMINEAITEMSGENKGRH